MNKIYFIDSENVGDSWISLLATVAPEDELLVFYTAKSPHMNYKNLILLKNSPKEVNFIECCEGNNALDFQLSTELGFRVHDINDNEFIIVSNDTGFDAIVKYWKQRNIMIKRIPANACNSEPVSINDSVSDLEIIPLQEPIIAPTVKPISVSSTTSETNDDDSAKEILYCIGKDNLPSLHDALKKIYGEKRGKQLYNAYKSDTSYSNYLAKHKKLNKDEKQAAYCKILFAQSKISMPADFPKYVMSSWSSKKNLNSLRSALQNKYAKDKFADYYSLIKAHIKILEKIK